MNQDENAKLVVVRGRGRAGLDLPVRQVVEKSAEKLVAGEEEGSTSPLPERVLIFRVFLEFLGCQFMSCCLGS